MAKEALVVKRELLFKGGEFQGFLDSGKRSFIRAILENYEYHERGDGLEKNSLLQQVIPYVWIVNPSKKEIFAYRRANNKNYSEKRLRNKWSCGIGGHIDREDSEDPIRKAMMREIIEEVRIIDRESRKLHYPLPEIVGYINDDLNDVGKVHFGVVAIAATSGIVEKADDEMAEGRFFSVNELEDLFRNPENEIEEWTKISWPFIRDYLNSL